MLVRFDREKRDAVVAGSGLLKDLAGMVVSYVPFEDDVAEDALTDPDLVRFEADRMRKHQLIWSNIVGLCGVLRLGTLNADIAYVEMKMGTHQQRVIASFARQLVRRGVDGVCIQAYSHTPQSAIQQMVGDCGVRVIVQGELLDQRTAVLIMDDGTDRLTVYMDPRPSVAIELRYV
jgi:hypothetical protein